MSELVEAMRQINPEMAMVMQAAEDATTAAERATRALILVVNDLGAHISPTTAKAVAAVLRGDHD